MYVFFLWSPCLFATDEAADFSQKLSAAITFPAGEEHHIGRIVINDRQNGITTATWIYVSSALSVYKKTKPACIILELDTPGGEVFTAERIADALQEMDTQYNIPVIAYVNNWAMSAGALLAYSCRFIVIAKGASMGAAEPVTLGATGQMEAAPEKITSALRSDFASRAQFFGRNSAIAMAMVDKDLILVRRQGKIITLDTEDQVHKDGPQPDVILKPKGKLLTLNTEQLMEYGVADMMLPPMRLPPLTEQEERQEQETGRIPLQKSPFIQIPFFEHALPCSIDTFREDWQTRFLAFLTLPAVSSILFLGLIVGFYMEMTSSGFGIAGLVGLLSLFFIVLSSFALEAVAWFEPIMLLFGLFLIGLELFFFPTMGILGVLGTLFMVVGLMGMVLPGIESVQFNGEVLNSAGEYVLHRLGWICGAIVVAAFIIIILSRFMTPKFRLMHRIILEDTPLLSSGTHAMHAAEIVPEVPIQVGDEAIVSVTCRPSGKVIYKGIELDVVSTGDFLEKGKRVTIVRIEGLKIFIE